MSLYLVTGGAGFIGSSIVAELLRRGERVRVLDNFATGRRENLAPFAADIEIVEGDLRGMSAIHRAVQGAEVVFHEAALPSVQRSIDDPETTHMVNATGTLNMLLAARDAGVRRVVFAASSSVYGDSPTLPKREDMLPRPKSPYAASKLAGEHFCRIFADVYRLETVCLRYFNVFGPRQDPNSQYAAVIPRFIEAMLAGKAPTVYGDGGQSRDFTYVANVVEANLLAATAPNVSGQVFNIACGQRYTLLDLIGILNGLLGASIAPHCVEGRAGDVRHSLADVSLAQEHLGYRVEVGFEEGLRRTLEWFRQGGSSR